MFLYVYILICMIEICRFMSVYILAMINIMFVHKPECFLLRGTHLSFSFSLQLNFQEELLLHLLGMNIAHFRIILYSSELNL